MKNNYVYVDILKQDSHEISKLSCILPFDKLLCSVDMWMDGYML